jgi:predicted RNA-binding protein with PUA-like domain
MNYWIFQSRPERFDLRTRLVEGQSDDWVASRYRNAMQPGDLVFFWLSGDEAIRGIYGWGKLTSEPYADSSEEGYGVKLVYEKKLREHIPVRVIREHDQLSDLLILKVAIGTNFKISPEEASAIAALIAPDERPPSIAHG